MKSYYDHLGLMPILIETTSENIVFLYELDLSFY